MRSFIAFLLLASLLVVLSACSSGAASLISGPEVNVTPATAPISIPGVTPPVLNGHSETSGAGQAPIDVAIASADPADTVVIQDPTPTLVRTPIRLKVPATPPVFPTDTPTPTHTATITPTATDTPLATDTPEAVAVEEVTPTPNFITATPTDTATPRVITATPTAVPAQVEAQPTQAPEAAVAVPQGLDHTLNILVVGSDERRPNVPWRSDVIMIAAVDFETKQVGVLSLPRDLWVPIPTVGENRINTATFWGELNKYPDGGGIGLLKETIARDFGIRIDHYIKFNFDSFKDVVDAMGGVDITVQCPITGNFPREEGSQQKVWKTLQPGDYHMDGFFALLYARQRKTTSDIDRTKRQQQLMVALRNRAREINIVPRLPALYDALKGTVKTDLGLTDLIALSRLALQIDPKAAHGYSIGFKETRSWRTPAGAAVLLPHWDLIQEKIDHLFEQPTILKNPDKPNKCR